MAPSSKGLLNRREVSVASKATDAGALAKKQTAAESISSAGALGPVGGNEETKKKSEGMTAKGRVRKRKSVSPKSKIISSTFVLLRT